MGRRDQGGETGRRKGHVMKGAIYTGTVAPANRSPDGETASQVILTEESNGFAIWFSDHDGGTRLVEYLQHTTRNVAIELAVQATMSRREFEAAEATS